MATIKEMAGKYAYYERSDDLPNEGGYDLQKLESYIAGANAVLEEIENVVTNNEDNTLCMARCLVSKIKELKG